MLRRTLLGAAACTTLAAGTLLGQEFTRGDCNADGSGVAAGNGGDGRCDIADPVFLLGYLFRGGAAPPCLEACNSNDDDELDIADAIYQLLYCFLGGNAPLPPFGACGRDPTPSLPCRAFLPCGPPDRCAPMDAAGVGPCDAFFGYRWNGAACEGVSGCSCEGEDCDELYDSFEECERAHAGCPPPSCEPMHVIPRGPCRVVLGWHFDGRQCLPLSACECEGADCDRLYDTFEECLGAHGECPDLCAPWDVEGVGPCDAVLGWYWDGFRCRELSGCECEGEDCERLFASGGECSIAVAQHCPPPCSPMEVTAEGACEAILGHFWDGASCQVLVGCECVGVDCSRLATLEECLAAHARCPPPCVPMDVREVGTCEPIHGYYWDGASCRALSGCECAGADCERLFGSLEECLAVNSGCEAAAGE